ncbi:MAG TPA: glycosyltransferase family 2 protein [bacterium]
MKLSIVVPVYNEAATLGRLLDRVLQVDYGCDAEILLVNDGSTDGTAIEADRWASLDSRIRAIHHEHNRGKGAAVRTGLQQASGDVVIVQDADLEYDPGEIPRVIHPILIGVADVVFGSRFSSGGPHRVLYFWHSVGNHFLTLLSNIFTNLNLTDMEVCYKAFRREVIQSVALREDRFGFEPEITAKIAQGGWRIYEVPISYYGRTYEEGKKIAWRDGVRAVWCILKYNVFMRASRQRRPASK